MVCWVSNDYVSPSCGLSILAHPVSYGGFQGQTDVPGGHAAVWVSVAAGGYHTCGLKPSMEIVCWYFGMFRLCSDLFPVIVTGETIRRVLLRIAVTAVV